MNAVSEQELTEEFNKADITQPEQVTGTVHSRSLFAHRIFSKSPVKLLGRKRLPGLQ